MFEKSDSLDQEGSLAFPRCRSFGGDVTAVTIIDILDDKLTVRQKALLVGIGSQIHCLSLSNGQHIFSKKALPDGVHVHGIKAESFKGPWTHIRGEIVPQTEDGKQETSTHPEGPPGSSHPCGGAWIAVYGGRFISIFEFSVSGLKNLSHGAVMLPAWVMAADLTRLTIGRRASDLQMSSVDGILTAVLSDNSVLFYIIHSLQGSHLGQVSEERYLVPVYVAKCEEKCLLYSADLLVALTETEEKKGSMKRANDGLTHRLSCLVAAGTIMYDVIVWKVTVDLTQWGLNWSPAVSGEHRESVVQYDSAHPLKRDCDVPVALRLRGHEGSIHTVSWSSSANMLASGSDDRTLRVWDVRLFLDLRSDESDGSNASKQSILERRFSLDNRDIKPRFVLYGHLARLWRVTFAPGEQIIASASEDGTCKLWSMESGVCLRTLNKAHRFRGVWHCLFHDTMLFTAGADGAVKAWNLWDWLPCQHVERLQRTTICMSDVLELHSRKAARNLVFERIDGLDGGQGNDSKRQVPWQYFMLSGKLPSPDTVHVGASWSIEVSRHGIFEAKVCPWEPVGYSSPVSGEKPRVPTDSRFERPRCFQLSPDGSQLFVATSQGLIYKVQFPNTGSLAKQACASSQDDVLEECWTVLYKSSRRTPIVSLSIAETGTVADGECTLDASFRDMKIASCTIHGAEVAEFSGFKGVRNVLSQLVGAVDLTGSAVLLRLPVLNCETNLHGPCDNTHRMSTSSSSNIQSIEWNPFEKSNQPALGVFFADPLLPQRLVFVPGGQGELAVCYMGEHTWGDSSDIELPSDEIPSDGADFHYPKSLRQPTTIARAICPRRLRVVNVRACLLKESSCCNCVDTERRQPQGWTSEEWLLATGASCGGLALWKLTLWCPCGRCSSAVETNGSSSQSKAHDAQRVWCTADCSVCPKAELDALTIVSNDFKIRASLRCLHLGWVSDPDGRGLRIELECGTTAGMIERFQVCLTPTSHTSEIEISNDISEELSSVQVARPLKEKATPSEGSIVLQRLGERRCDAVGIVAGSTGPYSFRKTCESFINRRQESRSLVWGFESTNFVVYDESAEMEVCSVYVVAQKKPWAARVASADDIVLCFAMLDKIYVYRRGCGTGGYATKCVRSSSEAKDQASFRHDEESKKDQLETEHKDSLRNMNQAAYGQNVEETSQEVCSAISQELIASNVPWSLPQAVVSSGHGNDVNAIRMLVICRESRNLEIGGQSLNAETMPVVALTGGEDALVRQALDQGYCHPDDSPSVMQWHPVGHCFGSSVRSLAIAPLHHLSHEMRNGSPQPHSSWIAIAACAKQIMLAWILRIDDSDRTRVGSTSSAAHRSWRENGMLSAERVSIHAPFTSLGRSQRKTTTSRQKVAESERTLHRKNVGTGEMALQLRCLAVDALVVHILDKSFAEYPVMCEKEKSPLRLARGVLEVSRGGSNQKMQARNRDPMCDSFNTTAWASCLVLSANSDGTTELRSLLFEHVVDDDRHTVPAACGKKGVYRCVHPAARASTSFEPEFSEWPLVCRLEKQRAPIISMRLIMLSNKSDCIVAFSGTTEGCILMWSLSSSVVGFMQIVAGFPESSDSTHGSMSPSSSKIQADNWPRRDWLPPELMPVASFPSVHQSGVNALSVAEWKGKERAKAILVVSAGDDQALHGMLLSFAGWSCENSIRRSESHEMTRSLISQWCQPCAHSSAIRGVWTDGRLVYSVGLDRKLRRWRIYEDDSASCDEEGMAARKEGAIGSAITFVEDACFPLQVVEPSALDVSCSQQYVEPNQREQVTYEIGVAGKGVEIVQDTVCFPSSN